MFKSDQSLGNLLQGLDLVLGELAYKRKSFDPCNYGLPNLLIPQDQTPHKTADAFDNWRRDQLNDFIETRLYGVKDNQKFSIKLIPKMQIMLGDLFFRRVQKAILRKSRGTGGSLSAAILMWLSGVYHSMSFLQMGGSSNQSKYIYEYTTGFWNCFPELSNAILSGVPLQSITRLNNGVKFETIGTSEKSGRGKHEAGFIADEANQEARNVDKAFRAAMQGALARPNHMMLILSTFQHPDGFFQEVFDNAEDLKFTVYDWDVYDALEKCEEGLEGATRNDPMALNHCQKKCALTRTRKLTDAVGRDLGTVFIGCNGKARKSEGFHPKSYAENALEMNKGTTIYETEYENARPGLDKTVYPNDLVEEAGDTNEFYFDPGALCAVGIDFGQTAPSVVTLAVRGMDKEVDGQDCIGITECQFFVGKMTREIITFLQELRSIYGEFPVYTDASSHGGVYNTKEIALAGYNVRGINFGKWKGFGITNLQRYFGFRKIKILREFQVLLRQLKRLRWDDSGTKVIKKSDHGPDSLLLAMLHFIYSIEYGEEQRDEDLTAQQVILLGGDDSSEDEE